MKSTSFWATASGCHFSKLLGGLPATSRRDEGVLEVHHLRKDTCTPSLKLTRHFRLNVSWFITFILLSQTTLIRFCWRSSLSYTSAHSSTTSPTVIVNEVKHCFFDLFAPFIKSERRHFPHKMAILQRLFRWTSITSKLSFHSLLLPTFQYLPCLLQTDKSGQGQVSNESVLKKFHNTILHSFYIHSMVNHLHWWARPCTTIKKLFSLFINFLSWIDRPCLFLEPQ